jgi:hypothetical protein
MPTPDPFTEIRRLHYSIKFIPSEPTSSVDLSSPFQIALVALLNPDQTPTGNRYIISYDLTEPCAGPSSRYTFINSDGSTKMAWNTLLGYLECEARALHAKTFLPATNIQE